MITGTNISTLVQGDSFAVWLSRAGYPSSTWAAQLAFTQEGESLLAVPGVLNGLGWDFAVTPVESATLTPGPAQVYLVTTQGALRSSAYYGSISILPNPMADMPPTDAMLALAGVNASIAAILSQPEASANLNGQSYTLHNIRDLYEIRGQLLAEVSQELIEMGVSTGSPYRIIQNRFV